MQEIPVEWVPHCGPFCQKRRPLCIGRVHVGTAALGCPAAWKYRAVLLFLFGAPERNTKSVAVAAPRVRAAIAEIGFTFESFRSGCSILRCSRAWGRLFCIIGSSFTAYW